MDKIGGPPKEGPDNREQTAGAAVASKDGVKEHHSDEEDSDNDFEKISESDTESENYTSTGVDQSGHASLPVRSMIPSFHIAGPDVTANKSVLSDGATLKKVGKKWILKVDDKSVMLPEDIANSKKPLELVGGYISSDDNVYEIKKVANGKVEIVPMDVANVKPKTTALQEQAEKKVALSQSKLDKEVNSGMDNQKKDGQKERKTSDEIGTNIRNETTSGANKNTSQTRGEGKLPSMKDMLGTDGKTYDQLSEKDDKNKNRDESPGMSEGDKKPADTSQDRPDILPADQYVAGDKECTGVDEARHTPTVARSGDSNRSESDSATVHHQRQGTGNFKAQHTPAGARSGASNRLEGDSTVTDHQGQDTGELKAQHTLAGVRSGDSNTPEGDSTTVHHQRQGTEEFKAQHTPAGAMSGASNTHEDGSAATDHRRQGTGEHKAEMDQSQPPLPPKANKQTNVGDQGQRKGTDAVDGDGNPQAPPRTVSAKKRSVRTGGDRDTATGRAVGASQHRTDSGGAGKPVVVKGDAGTASEMTIVIFILYEMITEGKLEENSQPVHYLCSQQTFLKWNYVVRNSKLIGKKRLQYRESFSTEITADHDIVLVKLGRMVNGPDFPQIANSVVDHMLSDTEDLTDVGFATTGVDTMKCLQLIMGSELCQNQQVYVTVLPDSKFIHAVYPNDYKVKVSNLISSSIRKLKQAEGKETTVEYPIRIVLPLVFWSMVQNDNLGKDLKRLYPDITLDLSVADDKVVVCLKGLKQNTCDAAKWLKETYINKYKMYTQNSVSLKDISYAEKFDDIAGILHDVMERICSDRPDLTDVHWYINKETSQIDIIALQQSTVDKVSSKIRKIIKTKPLKLEGNMRDVQRKEQLCKVFQSRHVHIDVGVDSMDIYFAAALNENIMEEIGRWIEQVKREETSPREATVSTSACHSDPDTGKARDVAPEEQLSNTEQSDVTDLFKVGSSSLFQKLKESNIQNSLSTKFGIVAALFENHPLFGFTLMGPAKQVEECKIHLHEMINRKPDALKPKADIQVDNLNKMPEDSYGGQKAQRKPVLEPRNEPKTVKYTVQIHEYKVYQYLCKPGVIDELAKKHNIVAELKGNSEKQVVFIQGTSEAFAGFQEDLQRLTDQLCTGDVEEQDDRGMLSIRDQACAAGGAEDQLMMAGEVMETRWTLPHEHSLVVSTADAKNSWKELLVEMDTCPTSKVTSQIDYVENKKKKTVLYIPNEGEGKVKDKLETLIKEMLGNAVTEDCFHIVIAFRALGGLKPRQLMVQIVLGLREFYSKEGHPSTVIRMCVQGSDTYTVLCDVCKYAFPDVLEAEDPPGLTVSVVTGSLHQTPADVIVNTTSHQLDLDAGFVSTALLRVAGNELQTEAKAKRPSNFNYGEIVETKGYGLVSLGCKHVLHGALRPYKDGNATQNLKALHTFVYLCMIRADDLKCRVISFPAMGTGNLGYPKKEVAKTMFEAVKDFESKDGSESHVKEVKFVIFEKDTDAVKEFKKKEEEYQRFKLEKKRDTTVKQWSGDVNIDRVRVHAEKGSITSVNAQGMIYLWPGNYIQTVMVKNHPLLIEAGVKVQQDWTAERQRSKKQPQYTPFTTDGGNLKIPVIVHVPCGGQKSGIIQAFRAGLKEVDNQRCHSVVIPFNTQHPFMQNPGTVIGDALLEAVKFTESSLHYLRDVIMVIEDGPIFTATQKRFNSCKGDNQPILPKTASHSDTSGRTAPTSQKIDRGTDVVAEMGSTGNQHLPSEQPNYCVIKAVPEDCDEQRIKQLVAARMRTSNVPKVVYSAKLKQAVLICDSEADAQYLTTCPLPFTIQLFVPKLQTFERKVKKSDLAINIEDLRQLMKPIDVCVEHDKDDSSNIVVMAPTSCQMVCAENILTKYTNSTDADDDNGFTDTESLTITEDGWDILRTLEHDKITKIESGGKITFDKDNLYVQHDVGNSKLKGIVEKLKSISLKLKDKQIEQIPLDNYMDAERWCKEIGETLLTNCCVFVKDKNCVLAFCDTYEDVQKVKHQFKIKEGKVKVTARGRRDFQVSEEDLMNTADESGPTSLQAMQSQLGMVRHVQPRKLSVDFEWSRDAKHVKSYKTPEGIQVYVYVADILKLPVDCIVNAANDSLQHGGGVAKVIARAAGYELNRESAEYIRNKGNVPVGQACYTTAGKLHYDCVVHAVGPCWSHYSPHSLEDVKSCQIHLHSAVYQSFLQAEKRNLKSIALPAISSAIFGVPVEMCVYNYARATLDYSRKAQKDAALTEIHFIDVKKAIVKEIQDMFDVMIDQDRKPDYYNIEKFAQQPMSSQWNRSTYDNRGAYSGRNKNQSPPNQNRRSSGNVDSPIQSPRMSSGNVASPVQSPSATGGSPGFQTSLVKYEDRGKQVYVFRDQQKVTVYKGDIFEAEAQAIVSVEDLNCKGTGRIAKGLTNRVKEPGYSTGKNYKFSQRPRKIGDVFVTDGFHSGFRKILHAILPYEISMKRNDERKQLIAKAFKNVFVTAHSERIDSVALALIGVGANKPEDVRLSTKAFLESFTEFCDSGKQLSILLVCYDQEKMTQVCQVFDQNRDQSSSGASSGSPPPRPPLPEGHRARSGDPPPMRYNTRSGDQYGRGTEAMDTSPPMGGSVYRKEEKMEVDPEAGVQPESTTDDDCVICMDKITERKQLPCGHVFCEECIDQSFKHKEQCPTCGKVCGIITGTQPEGTILIKTKQWERCSGYEQYGRINITYTFPNGVQGEEHPTPGAQYKGISRTAYLPDNTQGQKISKMLKVAFDRRLVFTIGRSTTTGHSGVITWNDIHHKTNPSPHTQFGYPDPGYLDRVTEELAAKGVTEKDIQ